MTFCRLHRSVPALLLAASLFGVVPSGASAQQPTQAQANAIRQACRGDYQAHCANVPAGGAAALQCLESKMASLSPGCQTAVGATQGGAAPPAAARAAPPPVMSPREEMALMRNACAGDFRAHCRGVRLGGGQALACLADHQESLSPPCREAMATARGAR